MELYLVRQVAQVRAGVGLGAVLLLLPATVLCLPLWAKLPALVPFISAHRKREGKERQAMSF